MFSKSGNHMIEFIIIIIAEKGVAATKALFLEVRTQTLMQYF